MSKKVQAIVLKSQDTKEKDVNVLLFSLEEGKVWATLKGVKSETAKLKSAQNQFVFGEFVLEDGKNGKIVTAFDMIESFHEISEDIDRFFEGCAILEILEKSEFSNEMERANIFVLALKTLKNICFEKTRNLYALDKFLIEFFQIFGVPLYSDRCMACKSPLFSINYVDYDAGQLVCGACKGFMCEKLEQTTFSALKILSNSDLDKIKSIKLANGSEKALLKVLVNNFEARFDTSLKLLGILS